MAQFLTNCTEKHRISTVAYRKGIVFYHWTPLKFFHRRYLKLVYFTKFPTNHLLRW